jgi:hypothetical protein
MEILQYIKDYYGLEFYIGQKVLALGKPGIITKGTHYVFVKLDGENIERNYHPKDIKVK